MTLGEYVKKRNGVPIGHPQSLSRNLNRSLGAKNFSSFWNYWNPIFGYYLGLKIFKPLKRFLPPKLSLVITFIFCGLIHDVVTILFRGQTSFLFSCWFLLMAIAVIISNYFNQNLAQYPWVVRSISNLLIILISLCFAYFLSRFLNIKIIIF
mgnify:CR=1 FL=1